MYNISTLKKLNDEYVKKCVSHFEVFFKTVDYNKKIDRKIKSVKICKYVDIENILRGPGFYLIATDYRASENKCKFKIKNDLKAIYRGHSYNVRDRIESHLFNKLHVSNEKSRSFEVCMSPDGNNGINIEENPYRSYSWLVVQHSMPKSLELMRESAELAFDNIFCKPFASIQ